MEILIPIAILLLVFAVSLYMAYWGISLLYRMFIRPKVQEQQEMKTEITELKEIVHSLEREIKQQK